MVKFDLPKVGLTVGKCVGVIYEPVPAREGDAPGTRYIHEFKKANRPDLVVSSDGRQFLPVGGKYRFTNAGFVD